MNKIDCLITSRFKFKKNYKINKTLSNLNNYDLNIKHQILTDPATTYTHNQQCEIDDIDIKRISDKKLIKKYLRSYFFINQHSHPNAKKIITYIASKKHKHIKLNGTIEVLISEKTKQRYFFKSNTYLINATLRLNSDSTTTIKNLQLKRIK